MANPTYTPQEWARLKLTGKTTGDAGNNPSDAQLAPELFAVVLLLRSRFSCLPGDVTNLFASLVAPDNEFYSRALGLLTAVSYRYQVRLSKDGVAILGTVKSQQWGDERVEYAAAASGTVVPETQWASEAMESLHQLACVKAARQTSAGEELFLFDTVGGRSAIRRCF